MEPVSFGVVGLTGSVSNNPTAIDFSKTGNPILFVAQQNGDIYRYEVERQPDGPDADTMDEFVATSTLQIDVIPEDTQNFDDDGDLNGNEKRQVTGMVVTKDDDGNDVLYVSSSDWRIAVGEDSGLDTNSGQVHRITLDPDTGAVLSNVAVLRGLPRSEENHANNGLDLAIDPATGDVVMYVAVGGITNKGAPGNNFAGTTDFAWSGSIIKINLTELESYDIRTDANGNQFILDLPTLDDPTRSNIDLTTLSIQDLNLDPNFTLDDNGEVGGVLQPDWAGGNNGLNQAKITDYVLVSEQGQLKLVDNPIELFAPGYRNPYDVIVMNNGEVFTWDNGPNGGWGGQPLSFSDGAIVDDWTTEYATNEFNEAGSSGFGDQLHYLGNVTDPYGTYGGHASPLRAAQIALQAAFNSDGTYAGATSSDPIIVNGIQIFDNEADARDYLEQLLIIYEQDGSGSWVDVTSDSGLPADLFDVLSGYDWSHPGSSIDNPLDFFDGTSVMDGTPYSPESQLLNPTEDGSLVVTPESTNGLTEFTASYFGGQLQGTIVAASFDETLYFTRLIDTDGDGRTDSAMIVHTESLNGSNPLALVALPDQGLSPTLIDNNGDGIDDFSGLIAVATYGADTVSFLIPGGMPVDPGDDLDEDGLNDIVDTHVGDPLDGLGVTIAQGETARWGFELSNPSSTPIGAVPPGNSIAGDIGVNAVFRDGVLAATDNGGDETQGLYNGGVFNLGGASSFVSLDVAHDGTAEGAVNTQQDVLGIGFGAPDALQLTISTEMVNIFTYSLNTDPPARVWDGGEKIGLVVGPGDQSNYAEATIAVVDDNGTIKYGVQLIVETDDSALTTFVEIPGIEAPVIAGVGDPNFQVAIDLDLAAGSESATARARYVDDGTYTDWVATSPLALPPDVVDAVKGQYDNLGTTTGAFVGMMASAPDGDDSFAASWDWIDVQNVDVPVGAARIGVTETSDDINKSTFDTGSFVITNTGEKIITQVEFDMTNAILPDAVFDPFGLAGDTVSKGLTIDSAGGTGVDTTPDGSNYVGIGGTSGYEGLIVTFDPALNGGFEPGETVTFSVDVNPNSVAGAGNSLLDAGASLGWDTGGISGAEIIGTTVTVTYADGSTSTGELISAGNDAGANTVSSQAEPGLEPTLTVNGLGDGGTGTYNSSGPAVILNGPAGSVARVTLAKGVVQPETNEFYNGDADDQAYAPQLDAQLAALATTDFPANNIVEFQTFDIVLDGSDQDISALFDFSGVADYDFVGEDEVPLAFVASIVDPNDANAPLGPTTQPIFLTFDPTPPPPPPSDPFRVEAETFDIVSGFVVQNNGGASGDQLLQAGSSGEQRASYTFTEAAGVYNLTLGYFDESDGQSQLSVLVNGVEVDNFIWNVDAGDAFANASSFAERDITGVELNAGDVIEIVGTSDGGEPLRTDYFDFTFVGAAGPDTTDPFVQAFSAPDIGQGDVGAASTQIVATFADNVSIDVSSIDAGDIIVTGPGGPLSVTGVSVNDGGDGTPRTATYTVATPGGTWDLADEGDYTVALKADEVLDTSGNAVAADPALATFTVDLSTPPPPPSDPFRVEAETFDIVSGFVVQNNGGASGDQLLQAGSSGEQRASYTFTEAAGVYNLTLGYFDESDGQSQLSVLVNGVEVDNFIWNVDAGDAFANASSFAERDITGVELNAGDVIEIVGTSDGGEPLRTDYFDFTFVDDQIA
ncbi:Ig-like domain-containing protein [Ruegeria halocynthiae]|uniref:Ig-like domain-containing protein n=1 Tax=Ruegeria halocynthiae TaxID=985054 RepID=UPI00055B813D|nr:Ig-like domain-containing protein [Ruegeria halocynthiae]